MYQLNSTNLQFWTAALAAETKNKIRGRFVEHRALTQRWTNSCASLNSLTLYENCCTVPSKRETLTQCWCNAGPSPATLAQHYTNIGWMSGVAVCLTWRQSHQCARTDKKTGAPFIRSEGCYCDHWSALVKSLTVCLITRSEPRGDRSSNVIIWPLVETNSIVIFCHNLSQSVTGRLLVTKSDSPDVGSMMGQMLRRWPENESTSCDWRGMWSLKLSLQIIHIISFIFFYIPKRNYFP